MFEKFNKTISNSIGKAILLGDLIIRIHNLVVNKTGGETGNLLKSI